MPIGIRLSLVRARRAARAHLWSEAATAYRRHLARHPGDARAWVQLGHACKESGDLGSALTAYRRAVSIAPADPENWTQVAHAERLNGNREASLQAFGEALKIDPMWEPALAGLIGYGARDRLPLVAQLSVEGETGVYSVARYQSFRQSAQVSPSDPDSGDDSVLAIIDARFCNEVDVSATLRSLDGQKSIRNRFVMLDEAAGAETLASANDRASLSHVLIIAAGTRLDPQAINWLSWALRRTGAGIAYADHDHFLDGDDEGTHVDPCLQPIRDPFWFETARALPPFLLLSLNAIDPTHTWAQLFRDRINLPYKYAQVPLLLGSRHARHRSVQRCVVVDGAEAAEQNDDSSIQVIIQTRDAADMLAACVTTLLDTAACPEKIDITIVDNRSEEPRTRRLLEKWSAAGVSRTLQLDEPFNWSRANNIAAATGSASMLLFLNNDVESTTRDWDLALRRYLASEDVAAIGALLLYPDLLIQHSGIILGMHGAGPVHEGLWHSPDPDRRWSRPRSASAVTGAWMATTRKTFERTGGFDEELAVSYNDVDFCLRCRALDRLVVQASDIVAIHRESATRGILMSPAQQARNHAEASRLRARWNTALDIDPGYNPQWTRMGQPFDGLRQPAMDEIVAWVDASARPVPWSVRQEQQ